MAQGLSELRQDKGSACCSVLPVLHNNHSSTNLAKISMSLLSDLERYNQLVHMSLPLALERYSQDQYGAALGVPRKTDSRIKGSRVVVCPSGTLQSLSVDAAVFVAFVLSLFVCTIIA